MPPIVKYWRDAGDTPCRQNHQEEANLWSLHTSSLHRESPLHTQTRRDPGPPLTSAQMAWEDTDKFYSTLCVPFDETTTEQHLRHYIQDWRLRWTPKLVRLKLCCIWTWRSFFLIFCFSFCFILFYFYICIYIFLSFTYFLFLFLSLFFLFFIFSPISVSLIPVQLTVN
jgi:hypothetical protein